MRLFEDHDATVVAAGKMQHRESLNVVGATIPPAGADYRSPGPRGCDHEPGGPSAPQPAGLGDPTPRTESGRRRVPVITLTSHRRPPQRRPGHLALVLPQQPEPLFLHLDRLALASAPPRHATITSAAEGPGSGRIAPVGTPLALRYSRNHSHFLVPGQFPRLAFPLLLSDPILAGDARRLGGRRGWSSWAAGRRRSAPRLRLPSTRAGPGEGPRSPSRGRPPPARPPWPTCRFPGTR